MEDWIGAFKLASLYSKKDDVCISDVIVCERVHVWCACMVCMYGVHHVCPCACAVMCVCVCMCDAYICGMCMA